MRHRKAEEEETWVCCVFVNFVHKKAGSFFLVFFSPSDFLHLVSFLEMSLSSQGDETLHPYNLVLLRFRSPLVNIVTAHI